LPGCRIPGSVARAGHAGSVRACAQVVRRSLYGGLGMARARVRAVAVLAIAGLMLLGAADVVAQLQRNFPANGAIGVVAGDPNLPLPLVRIDARLFRMAPGGIIVDQSNRTVLHAQIPRQAAAYVVFDGNGDILRMFLLTPDELQRLRAR
jgi:hypothetical protein